MRYSKQRDLILQVLSECQDHPTADVIYDRVKQHCPNVSLGTVYRNLKQFADEGKIITLETTDKSLHYDGRIMTHSHFVCEDCGKIIDIFDTCAVPTSLTDMGVLVRDSKVVFYGKCPTCSKRDLN